MEKIVVFTPSLNIGGIERILLTYSKGLASNGYAVTYLTLSHKGDFDFIACDNLDYENLGVKRLRNALFALIRFFRKAKPDVILVANETTLIIYLAKILSGIKVKIITSQHNYFDLYEKVGFKLIFVPKYIYPLCFKVIAVSDGIRKMLINNFNVPPRKVVTICNPIDTAEIRTLSMEPISNVPNDYILFVGRFDKVKNILFLLDSFSVFCKEYPHFKLLLLGGGEEEKNIVDKIRALGLQDSVSILGIKPNPYPYIKNARIVVLTSLTEAFPTVLLESLLLGTTIVSTPTQGAVDILQKGKYGYISNSFLSIEEFSNLLVKAEKNPLAKDSLIDYVTDNYNLTLKVKEFETLWK